MKLHKTIPIHTAFANTIYIQFYDSLFILFVCDYPNWNPSYYPVECRYLARKFTSA